MKENFTHITVLLDRSGSMDKVKTDTIGGFNTFIEEQKQVPGECTITLVQFNDTAETTYLDVPLAHVAPLTAETYKPAGWTALNDAFARTIDEVGARLAAKPEHERPSKIIFVVITDGEENKSLKFGGFDGRKKLADMVNHQTTKYAWAFTFLGANIDAFATGTSYGIDKSSIIAYHTSPVGVSNAFKSVSIGAAATRVSTAHGFTMDSFFENERNKEVITDAVLNTTNIADVVKKYTPAVDVTSTTIGGVVPVVDVTKTETTK